MIILCTNIFKIDRYKSIFKIDKQRRYIYICFDHIAPNSSLSLSFNLSIKYKIVVYH